MAVQATAGNLSLDLYFNFRVTLKVHERFRARAYISRIGVEQECQRLIAGLHARPGIARCARSASSAGRALPRSRRARLAHGGVPHRARP